MAEVIEAVYEGGVLRPRQPLDLKEHQVVRLRLLGSRSIADERCGRPKLDVPTEIARAIIESHDPELSELDDVCE